MIAWLSFKEETDGNFLLGFCSATGFSAFRFFFEGSSNLDSNSVVPPAVFAYFLALALAFCLSRLALMTLLMIKTVRISEREAGTVIVLVFQPASSRLPW